MVLGGLGGMTGLPLEIDETQVFYTTNEPIESLPILDKQITPAEAYRLSPLVQQINSEVKFPRGRLPSSYYASFMRQINSYLPRCSEKRDHEFKHARLKVARTMKDKLAGRPATVLTSQCIYCKADWCGLRYPLREDPRYPNETSLFQAQRRRDSAKAERPDISSLRRNTGEGL